MTAWEAIQISIESGTECRVPAVDFAAEERDELEQLADETFSVPGGLQMAGKTPDGDDWSVILDNGQGASKW